MAIVSLSLYQAFSTGVRVWQKSQEVALEEDVAIFFDKLGSDIRNAFTYSQFGYIGNEFKFSFPTIVYTPADPLLNMPEGEYVDQLGKVEYFYDVIGDKIYKREAHYAQALNGRYSQKRLLLTQVREFRFKYFYILDNKEIYQQELLDKTPSGVEVELEIVDREGSKKFKRYFEIAYKPTS